MSTEAPAAPLIRVDQMEDGSYRARVHDGAPEFCREVVRACLRELDEEREALEFVTEMFGVDSITTPDSRDKVERLRSLLPETEGEA